jgi:hypothetical protein
MAEAVPAGEVSVDPDLDRDLDLDPDPAPTPPYRVISDPSPRGGATLAAGSLDRSQPSEVLEHPWRSAAMNPGAFRG